MSEVSSSEQSDVRVIPSSAAHNVGRMVAAKIFESHGGPDSLCMDVDGLTKICALAAQTVINSVRGEWQ